MVGWLEEVPFPQWRKLSDCITTDEQVQGSSQSEKCPFLESNKFEIDFIDPNDGCRSLSHHHFMEIPGNEIIHIFHSFKLNTLPTLRPHASDISWQEFRKYYFKTPELRKYEEHCTDIENLMKRN